MKSTGMAGAHVIERPAPREVFLTSDRRLDVFFYTSNLPKYYQASSVLGQFGLTVRHFKSKRDPYSEDYALGKRALLEKAIEEVLRSVGRSNLFFVEDTSLRIEALSDREEDYPGLAVKEWFQETPFHELDGLLEGRGGDRRAIVKSDIALHVPGLRRPILFHGSTQGRVAEQPYSGPGKPQHPWLSPSTFNGWFVPEGSAKTLAEMSFDESWNHDFRTRCLVALVERLEEYAAALNLPSQAYTRRHPNENREQLSLAHVQRPSFVVVGRICAGKSTFGQRASQVHKFVHAEASRVVKSLAAEVGAESASPFQTAADVLGKLGPDAVALRVVDLYEADIPTGLVITGFRTLEELETIQREIPHCQIVLVEASERERFKRHLERGRLKDIETIEKFRAHDAEQESFGLLGVAQDFADILIRNEGSLDNYMAQIDAVTAGSPPYSAAGVSTHVQPRFQPMESQLYRCLVVLEMAGKPMDCNEIADNVSALGKAIRPNNANQVLKGFPQLARRFDMKKQKVRYEITPSGRTYLRLTSKVVPEDATLRSLPLFTS